MTFNPKSPGSRPSLREAAATWLTLLCVLLLIALAVSAGTVMLNRLFWKLFGVEWP